MTKQLISLLLILSLSVFAKDNITHKNIELKDSLLWKITGKELTEPSYLYGTMHILCDLSTTNKAKVQNAVDATQKLYLEVDMLNPEVAMDAMMIMSEGVIIKDIKDEEKKQKLLTLAEKHLGMKASLIENSTLFIVFSMLAIKASDSCDLPTSVEETLEAKYKNDRSRIAGLETIQEQMQFIKDSEVASLDNVIDGLVEFEEMKEVFEVMNEYYMSENITELYSLMTTPSDLYSQELIDNMMEILLDKRNKNWVKQIPGIAQKYPTLFAVGAGHLPGSNGVINLLRQDGYSVEAVF